MSSINQKTQSLEHVYLGSDPDKYNDNWYDRLKETDLSQNDFFIIDSITVKNVALLLKHNFVVARCVGNAEFGARSLGNRAILANPSNLENVKTINDVIKNRDFWMPFTPSILSEHVDDYIYNPKNLVSPFMTIGFNSIYGNRKDIVGGLHQGDFSVRPQFVDIDTNKEYWELINEFYKITNIPALLNTSLNLHGEPMNYSVSDAVRTLALSELDILQIPGNRLVCKKRAKLDIERVLA